MKRAYKYIVVAAALLVIPGLAAAATLDYDVTGTGLSPGFPSSATFSLDSAAFTNSGDDAITFNDVAVTTGSTTQKLDLTFSGAQSFPYGAGFLLSNSSMDIGAGTGSVPLFTGPDSDPLLSTGTFTFSAADGPGQIRFEVSGAPEPSTWALMIAGIAMIGGTLRYRRSRRALATI